jgi:hypothetical protein
VERLCQPVRVARMRAKVSGPDTGTTRAGQPVLVAAGAAIRSVTQSRKANAGIGRARW